MSAGPFIAESRGRATVFASTFREVIGLSWPLLTSSLLSTTSSVVDIAVIGHTSSASLAGVSIGIAAYMVAFSVVTPVATAHQIQAAKSFGADAPVEVLGSLRMALRVGVAAAVVLMVLSWLVASPFAQVTTATPAAAHAAVIYLVIRVVELPLAIPTLLLIGTLASAKHTRPGMWAFTAANLVNLALDLILVVILRLGAAGGAAGNVLGNLAALMVTVWLYNRRCSELGLPRAGRLFSQSARSLGSSFLGFVRLSAPLGVSGFLDYVGGLVLFATVGHFTAEAVAGARAIYTIMTAVYMFMRAFSNGTQILLGRSRGRNETALERSTLRVGLLITGALGVVVSLAVLAVPQLLGTVFLDAGTAQTASLGMRLLAATFPAMAVALMLTASVRSQGRTGLDMAANLSAIWLLQVPIFIIAAHFVSMPVAMAVCLFCYWSARAGIVLPAVYRSVVRHA